MSGSSRRWGRQKKAPKGYDYIKPVLDALDSEMREAVNAPHEGMRKDEALWPIHQINWQRSRYIYDMYYKYKKISRELYEWCLREKICDKGLAAKWYRFVLFFSPRTRPAASFCCCCCCCFFFF